MTDPEPPAALIRVTVHVDTLVDPRIVWPDGDWPDLVTADAVTDRIRALPGASAVIAAWDLPASVGVTVDAANPAWTQYESLFDPPERTVHTETRDVFGDDPGELAARAGRDAVTVAAVEAAWTERFGADR